jgi:large subunit ribosomal protein L10
VLNLEQKKAVVEQVTKLAGQAHAIVGVEYTKIPAVTMTDLRKSAREAGVRLQVVRNTLARRAFSGTEYAGIADQLVGPLLLAFSMADPGAAARVIRERIKGGLLLEVKVVAMPGKALRPSDLETLANLPSRSQALAMLAGVTQAPVAKLARTFAEIQGKLVRTVDAIRQEKEKQAA